MDAVKGHAAGDITTRNTLVRQGGPSRKQKQGRSKVKLVEATTIDLLAVAPTITIVRFAADAKNEKKSGSIDLAKEHPV